MICRVCSGTAVTVTATVGDYRIIACNYCGHGITDPSDEYVIPPEVKQWRVDYCAKNRERIIRSYQPLIDRVQAIKPVGWWLDVGCNTGLLLSAAKDRCYTAIGIEPDPDYARIARLKHRVYSDLSDYHGPDCDIITCIDVLEHVREPEQLLRQIHDRLAPNGIAVIQVPNRASTMARLCGDKWPWYIPPDHLHHFTVRSLLTMLMRARLFMPAGVEVRTWEPTSDYANSVVHAHVQSGAMRKLLRLSGIPYLVALINQKTRDSRDGGLIEVIVSK